MERPVYGLAMGLLDSVMGWFRKEASDVRDAVGKVEDDLSLDMDRRERELAATPEEKIAMIQEDSSSDDLLAEVQAKIDRAQGHAEATEEVAGIDNPDDPDDSGDPAHLDS